MIHKIIQKRIAKLGIILLAVFLVVVALDFFLSSQVHASNEELDRFNANIAQINSNLSVLNVEQKNRTEANDFYKTYDGTPSSRPENFNRNKAKEEIAVMRQKFGLNSLQLSITGFKEVILKESTSRSMLLRSNAIIKLSSSYDMPVYDFIAAIDDSLLGHVDITSISIKKMNDHDLNAVADISQGKTRDLLTGEVNFTWYAVVDPTLKPLSVQPIINPDSYAITPLNPDGQKDAQELFGKLDKVVTKLDENNKNSKPAPVQNNIQKPNAPKPATAAPVSVAPKADVNIDTKPVVNTPLNHQANMPVNSKNPAVSANGKVSKKLSDFAPQMNIKVNPQVNSFPIKPVNNGGKNAN